MYIMYFCHINKALLDILKVCGLFWYMVVLFSNKFFLLTILLFF